MVVVMVMDGGSGDSVKILRGGGILICLTQEISKVGSYLYVATPFFWYNSTTTCHIH